MFAGEPTARARRQMLAPPLQETAMLYCAVVFLVIALVAAVLGFSGIAAGAAGIAKVLFMVFIVLALASFLLGLMRRG